MPCPMIFLISHFAPLSNGVKDMLINTIYIIIYIIITEVIEG